MRNSTFKMQYARDSYLSIKDLVFTNKLAASIVRKPLAFDA